MIGAEKGGPQCLAPQGGPAQTGAVARPGLTGRVRSPQSAGSSVLSLGSTLNLLGCQDIET